MRREQSSIAVAVETSPFGTGFLEGGWTLPIRRELFQRGMQWVYYRGTFSDELVLIEQFLVGALREQESLDARAGGRHCRAR